MATYVNNRGTTGHAALMTKAYLLEDVLDFANVTTTADVAITPGSADVWQVLNIPAGSVVLNAGVDVLTVESTNTTTKVALGDGSAAYVAALIVTSTGSLTSGAATTEMFIMYDAADTLDITSSVAAPTDAKLRVWAIVADITAVDTAQRAKYT